MKKTKLLVLLLALVMVFSVVALTACATEATYTGECSYEKYGNTYGVKVDVTVKGDKITAIKLYTDEETGWHRTTSTWEANSENGDLGYTATEAAYPAYINKFIGKTVTEINAIDATATADAQTVGTAAYNITGATQSSARIIVAIQNALSKIAK